MMNIAAMSVVQLSQLSVSNVIHVGGTAHAPNNIIVYSVYCNLSEIPVITLEGFVFSLQSVCCNR